MYYYLLFANQNNLKTEIKHRKNVTKINKINLKFDAVSWTFVSKNSDTLSHVCVDFTKNNAYLMSTDLQEIYWHLFTRPLKINSTIVFHYCFQTADCKRFMLSEANIEFGKILKNQKEMCCLKRNLHIAVVDSKCLVFLWVTTCYSM